MEIKLATDLFNLEVQKRKYMGRCLVAGLCFWLSLTLVIAEDTANTNKSSLGGLIWSSAKEEGDLLVENRPQEDSTAATAVVHDPDGFDGGFYSLDSMLQWAIGIIVLVITCVMFSNKVIECQVIALAITRMTEIHATGLCVVGAVV